MNASSSLGASLIFLMIHHEEILEANAQVALVTWLPAYLVHLIR